MTTPDVRFDMFVWQAIPWPALRDDVQFLETMPIGTVWVGDHYAYPPSPTAPVLEAWTTLAALAAQTRRVRLGTAISNVATRHPAMLAKQAATVDCISGGRLDIGLGPGHFESELAWLGIPSRSPAGRVDRFREAVEIIDRLLRQPPVSYQGSFYQLTGAPLVPAPVQAPRPPLTLAANGTRALQVAAAYADVWLTLGEAGAKHDQALAGVRVRNRQLDECCLAIGREPAAIERAYFVGWADEVPFVSRDAFQEFVGRYREAGIQRFLFFFASAGQFGSAGAAGAFADRKVLEGFAAEAMQAA